jgi:hypothetical protein
MTSREEGRRESFKQLIGCEMVEVSFNGGLIAHYRGNTRRKVTSDYLFPG